jgi:CubicO group peptidase (beta-lactamase class C family)
VASLLPTSTPSAQDVDARGVLDLLDALERDGHDPHSIVLSRHGQVIARGWWAPYSPNRIQLLYSLSKSFAATAVGLLVDEGRVSLDTPGFNLIPAGDLPDDATIPERYRRLTLGQCLQMATGHDTEAWTPGPNEAAYLPTSDGTDPVLAAILAHEPEHEPGSAWAYNQIATYLVAAAVRGVTGGSLLDLLRPRLLERLDPDSPDAARWHVTATGRELGFSGLHLGTDAVHALAQTYLDRGRWQGKQLLSEDWVTTATTPTGLPNREEAPNPDWTHGYGCSFWGARLGYRGDGAYGQFAIVLPEQDIALAITEETTDMQGVLDLVWEHLVPAVGRPGSADDDAELARRLESLAVPMPGGSADGPSQATWTRSPDSTVADSYAAAELTADAGGWSLALEGTDAPIAIGHGQWAGSELVVGAARLPVVAAGGWQGQDFVAELRLIELPHRLLLRGRADGSMTLDWHEVPLYGTDPMALAVRFTEGLSQT